MGHHIRSGIQRFISPKIRICPMQLSTSYNGAIRGTSSDKIYNELGLAIFKKKDDGTAACLKFIKVFLQNIYST